MSSLPTPTTYPGGLSRRDVVAWRNAMFVIFGLCGLGMASWMSRTPAVRDALGIELEELGLLIFAISAGSIVGLLASSHIIARIGSRKTMALAFIVGPIGLAIAGMGVSFGPSFALVMGGLCIFGACFSTCDVAMNVSGAANERALRRSIMPIYHAFFSFGTMIGAALGALAERVGLPLWLHILMTAALMIVLAQIAVRFMQSEHLVEEGEEPVADDDHSKSWRGRLSIWRDKRTLLIGLIVLGMALAEGSANDWLAVAMVDGHGVDKPAGALLFGVFVTAMTVGRLVGVFFLDRFGRVPVLRVSAVLAIVGLTAVIFVPNLVIVTIGIVLWGLGSALGFPVGMSAAADDPKTAAARVSAVATIGYCAFLIGPLSIGILGGHFGILNGLLIVLVLIVVAALASGAAREPRLVVAAKA